MLVAWLLPDRGQIGVPNSIYHPVTEVHEQPPAPIVYPHKLPLSLRLFGCLILGAVEIVDLRLAQQASNLSL